MKGNLLSYIKEHYADEIREKVDKFLDRNRSKLFKIEKWNHSYSIIAELNYVNFRAAIHHDDSIDADIVLRVVANVKFSKSEEAKTYSYIRTLRLNCKLKIEETKIYYQFSRITLFGKRFKEKPYDENLLLTIKREEYQKYADNLVKCYGIERDESGAINPIDLLTKMNVHIILGAPSIDTKTYGMIVFEDMNMRIFDYRDSKWKEQLVKANTIIIDPITILKTSIASVKVTICHEAFHFHYHRMALKLMRFFSKQPSYLEYDNNDKSSNEAIKWMEIQAYGVAPYILVSDDAIKEYVKVNTKKTKYDNLDDFINLDYMADIIRNLNKNYDLTIPSLKRRLYDLGFSDSLGALNFNDLTKEYIDNYMVGSNDLDHNTTYEISEDLLIRAMAKDELLRDFFKDGLFAYVDSHIVVNDSKYIDRFAKKLTYHAKTHMNSCCIKFGIRYDDKNFSHKNLLFRDATKRLCFYLSDGYKDVIDKAKTKENKERLKGIMEVQAAIYPLNFHDALLYLMKYQNMEDKELIIDSGLDQSTISRYLRGETSCKTRRKCVALCCGLRLAPSLSEMMLSKCGLSFDNSEEDSLLKYILNSMVNSTPKERNELMKSYGFEPLTSEDYYKNSN